MSLSGFHPAVAAWFERRFAAPTPCQQAAWPIIRAGRHALIAAPTGSGKTLAAFLAAIDHLVHEAQTGELPDETRVVYVSPLKALSNDIQRNLEEPLAGITAALAADGARAAPIRAAVRTGDTPSSARAGMLRRPPHIVVTTPESLYLLLTSAGGRRMLGTVRSVIVDEIHALAGSRRGAHLALSLERLQALAGRQLVRIGLSATQKPIAEVARFLVGTAGIAADGRAECAVIDLGHARTRDLAIAIPDSPLEAVMSGEVWGEVYDRLAALVQAHRTTLVFVNTRRLAERVAHHLAERLGEEQVTSHHGSLARAQRLRAEQRLKAGELKALVATASLELGIDIGPIDLVCQLGSTRSIATFLQRAGRAGHALQALPKARLFPLSRDDLIECAALLDAARDGDLDRLAIPAQPLDVLAQQIVAMVACGEWREDELFACVRRAYPYRDLPRDRFDQTVRMLAEGFSTRRGRRAAYVHRDAVNRVLRPRRGARLTALTCGGTIPENADYDVVLEPQGTLVGTLNEDFAIESLAGDVFQLGNTAWRILRIERGKVRVQDALGQPPNIPFWFGEAPARSDELTAATRALRAAIGARLGASGGDRDAVTRWLTAASTLPPAAARQIVDYLAAARVVLSALPDADTLVLERFFDESGGMQLVIHSPHGSRLNRALGLALRKRFCRKFNFELQAAATEDAVVLSLGETHSFPLAEVAGYLRAASVRDVLTQAVLDAPLFGVRWRWNATVALAVPRFRSGRKVAPQLQRMQAEDLLAVIFPDQLACAENLTGRRTIPEHPLVAQTLRDCLEEAMDIGGLERLLAGIESGRIGVITRDLPEPSPLAQEILSARPYAFLDDAPLEERRTQAVQSRRWLDAQSAGEYGALDRSAIDEVRAQAWPQMTNLEELHDAMLLLGFLTAEELARAHPAAASWMEALAAAGRATVLETHAGAPLLVAAERLPQLLAVFPEARCTPPIAAPPEFAARSWPPEAALVELVRGRVEGLGPSTASALAAPLGLPVPRIEVALAALEAEGFVLRGRFTPDASGTEWCERRLLARIHRYTLGRLRREIEPVTAADFMRFLLQWQHLSPEERMEGEHALAAVLEQLQGFSAPAAAWEAEILPARVADYQPGWLDALCLSGRFTWLRLRPPRGDGSPAGEPGAPAMRPLRSSPITLLTRTAVPHWLALGGDALGASRERLSPAARNVHAALARLGASFFADLVAATGLLRTQTEEALAELVAAGLVNADSFRGLRSLLVPSARRPPFTRRQRQRRSTGAGIEEAGRWVLLRPPDPAAEASPTMHGPLVWNACGLPEETVETVARTLLRRYGVVFKRLLDREPGLPPWRALLYVLRRLEARGTIRGGRFVAGFAGEQFALPEALASLREVRRRPRSPEHTVAVSGADPLNLLGLLTPGTRLAATAANRILYRDGVPVALYAAGEVRFLERHDAAEEWEVRNALLRRRIPPALQAPAPRPQ